ncbi:MAG: hypothetical protein ACKO0W_00535 [Planctomycetota bacterium]
MPQALPWTPASAAGDDVARPPSEGGAPPGRTIHRGALACVAAGMLAAGAMVAMVAMPACQSFGPAIVHAAINLCIEAVKSLIDAPADTLPPGYERCSSSLWQVRDQSIELCFYCRPGTSDAVFVQFDCEGSFYPLRIRRMGRGAPPTASTDADGISIKSIDCDEQLLIAAEGRLSPALDQAATGFRSPNARVLPDRSAHRKLEVSIDGVPAPQRGDFMVPAGARIALSGDIGEVAHYGLACGVTELAFSDGSDLWEVFAHPDACIALVFRNGALVERRLLFAPTAP